MVMNDIVKVQRPLIGTTGPALFLVYAEGRRNVCQQEPTVEVINALYGDPKGYFEAEWNGREWVIGKRVKERRW
jgi:hypothetical protein